MLVLKHLPKKVKFMMELSFPLINKLYPRKPFIGGRVGFPKELVFKWLLVKKITNWDYRSVAVRRNKQFERKEIYQKLFGYLVKEAVKIGLINGEKVAIDSSFVKTYSGEEENGSCGFNGYKKADGFKLHALIDAKTKFPLALVVTNGLVNDCQIALPLLKRAKPYLKRQGYVLADKGYDSTDIVAWIMQKLKSKLAKGRKGRYGNLANWKLKAVGRTFKKSILNLRTEIERFFSTLKRTFYMGKELTRGIKAFTGNAYLSLISYCLKRFYVVGVRYV